MSVLRKILSVKIIEALIWVNDHELMADLGKQLILVFGVTGSAPVTFAEFTAKTAPAWK
jgi:hypothetical protein